MQTKTSRIKPPRRLVQEIVDYLLSQVGVYDDLNLNVTVPPPPRSHRHIPDQELKIEVIPVNISEKFNFEAQYKPTNSILYVNLPLFEYHYEGRELENALYKVVSHELVHVYQIIYTRVRENDPRADSPTAGLPSLRERTPQYRQETGDILHHRLDDNEFYPRLEDTINAIEFVLRDYPEDAPQVVSYVIGESRTSKYKSRLLKEPTEWLRDLAKYAPRKYVKAVRKIKNEFPETAKMRTADFFRQVSPPDELSTLNNGTPTGKGTDLEDKGEGSQLPNGDGARNIGRPGPDSPNLKSRKIDRSESYGRKPAEGFDGGYVHDSGSGSARVIPYDSGFANNSSPLRKASSKVKPMFLGSESGAMAYDFYFMRVEKDYYYHYTYRGRADEIIEDGHLRPNFYKDQPGGQGVFAISGSYGQEVTSLQVSGSRKEHIEKVVALKFKTRTEPKYGYPEEVIWDKPVKLIRPEIVSVSEAVADLRKNEDLGEYFKVFYDFKKALTIKKEYGRTNAQRVAHRYLKQSSMTFRVAHRYLQSAAQPAQDLGGVKTWVDKTRQDQIKNDTSAPDKSRDDYADGKPQRDRVLPLPSGHPEGRDEQRVGPGVINSPPDSSGAGSANRPKKDPSALKDHPDGKALHERPRSSGIPGDQYGNPHIDQSTSTGLKRRVMGRSDEDFEFWDIEGDDLIKVALFRYNYRPPKGNKRQRKQKGVAKRKSQKYKRKYRVKYRRNLLKQKRLYKRKKHNPTYKKYKKNYAKHPEKYKRRPGGGVSTTKQKNQRAEKRRKKADNE